VEAAVGFLDHFERSVERAVGGAFAKTFKSGVHPVEIVATVKREMDSHAQVVSRERILVPSDYFLIVSAADEHRLATLGDALLREIETALTDHMSAQGYSAPGPIRVTWEVGDRLVEGVVEAQAIRPSDGIVWIPLLTLGNQRFPLTQRRTLLGRGSDADIPVTGRGISRHHCEIVWDGKRAEIADLGSTNGTLVDGVAVSRAALPDRCTITLGNTRIVCEVVAQQSSRYQMLLQNQAGGAL
jgi:hypothetical protein